MVKKIEKGDVVIRFLYTLKNLDPYALLNVVAHVIQKLLICFTNDK
jgi:hypothetical protein